MKSTPRFILPGACLAALLLGLAALSFARSPDDPVTAWRLWKDIAPAVELRDLDGPEDILEKAEIIEDRVDELRREQARLEAEIALHRQKLVALRNQREVLQDLAEIRLGGDAPARQRLQDLAARIRQEEAELARRKESVAALRAELGRWRDRAAAYREKARRLRIEEGG